MRATQEKSETRLRVEAAILQGKPDEEILPLTHDLSAGPYFGSRAVLWIRGQLRRQEARAARMNRVRPKKADLEAVPWAPPPDPPKYVSEMFYGRIVVAHHDDEVIREIGKRLKTPLEDIAKELGLKTLIFRVQWVLESGLRGRRDIKVDAVMDPTTGKWVRPEER